jgi:hypothetical protein
MKNIKRHQKYLIYILRHKWYVFVASMKIHAPIWRAIIHDYSKFSPFEWIPYAEAFYAKDGTSQYVESERFDQAWNKHQKRNKHHWQYWILKLDSKKDPILLEMPKKYVLEMVADWMGAGKAITGRWEVKEWYAKNKLKIMLNPKTRKQVETIIEELK